MGKGRSAGSSRSTLSGWFVTAEQGKASPRMIVVKRSVGGSAGGTYQSAVSGRFVKRAWQALT